MVSVPTNNKQIRFFDVLLHEFISEVLVTLYVGNYFRDNKYFAKMVGN